ncbi:MAG TPA: glycosyl hydrolase, partial [Clostridiales bacterium]|nr:glycosyl hydrolase [Clostridiales bacterium]
PFGFGLSYSEFRYGDLKITVNGMDAEVGFWVENMSEKDGKEVVQVYVSELSPAVYRPVKELKGYAKPEIKSGEKKRVIIKLNERSFAYYSVADDCWRVNDGAYRISVGSSSRDIRLSAVIKIENGKIV